MLALVFHRSILGQASNGKVSVSPQVNASIGPTRDVQSNVVTSLFGFEASAPQRRCSQQPSSILVSLDVACHWLPADYEMQL